MLARLLNAALGIWLMAAPAVLGYSGPAATNDHIVGPLIASFAIIAMTGATRPVRRMNTLLGSWLLVAPWVFGFESVALLNSLLVGVLGIGLSLVRGEIRDHFGGGWSALWRSGDPGA